MPDLSPIEVIALENVIDTLRTRGYSEDGVAIPLIQKMIDDSKPVEPLPDGWYLLDDRIPYYNQGGRLFECHETGALGVAHMNDFARERFTPLFAQNTISEGALGRIAEEFRDRTGTYYAQTLRSAVQAAGIRVE